ncbi:MAG: diguanylate cyclase [Gammaproteobacteria bacterium]|nr:diguanylate cyclase [Gammaproteobacteria bacterium]
MRTHKQPYIQSLSILIIDDSTSERVLLRTLLRKSGHAVTEAATGLHALALLSDKSKMFDLIFLDVRMPGINGYETAHRIRDIEKEQSAVWCPIIFLSGHTDPEDIANGIAAGGDDYLAKPVNAIIVNSKITAMQRIANMRQQLLVANQKLETLAHTDELTRLPNRRHFLDILDSELARAQRHNTPLSIAYMDLDHFKQINDTHGHEAGDTVLLSVANVLSKNLRSEDSIGRIGGEEFCICLPGADATRSLEPCERYRSLIENLKIRTSVQTLTVTASFGLTSILPGSGSDDTGHLLARADEALYQAKQHGRNRIEVRDVHVITSRSGAHI